ncbi:MAG TPA: hypothetical protein VFW38_03785 [Solirubrobacteraceae bacterium]|nr:hypothetical protein [Solirubrobacteraceae bacterium]
MQSTNRGSTDLLRAGGALLLVAGATSLAMRKGMQHTWSEVVLLLLVAVPAILLFQLALPRADTDSNAEAEAPEPARAVMMVAAIVLALPSIAELLNLLGVNTSSPLAILFTLLLTALVAWYGAIAAGVSYAALLGSLAALAAWLVLWGQSFDHPTASDFRDVLLLGGVLLLLAAYWRSQHDRLGAREIATTAGIALIAAGTLGIFAGAATGISQAVVPALSHTPRGAIGAASPSPDGQRFGWDLYLLVVSVVLIWLGARVHARGIAYSGGFGIFLFVFSIGVQVSRVDAGKVPTGSLGGWPLVLLVLGALGLLVAAIPRSQS